MENIALIAALIVLVIGTRAGIGRAATLRRTRRRARHRDVPLPHLIIPTTAGAADILPAGVRRDPVPVAAAETFTELAAKPASATAPAPATAGPSSTVPQEQLPEREATLPKRPAKQRTPAKRRTADRPELDRERDLERWMEPSARRATDSAADSAESPDATIVFKRPRNDAVQVLPGRLHVLSGEGAGKDLRLFSRVGERPRIVVGRDAGPAHRYITLRSPTVSRRHARMEFIDGQWTITNLSATNPVMVNDRALTDPSSVQTLSNGDRIELGEIALRFLAS